MRTPRIALVTILLSALCLVPVASQTITATVAGVVRDQSGGVLPGATVTVTSNETGIAKTVVTDEVGRYRVAFLNPGSYKVTAELSGFSPSTRPDVVLQVAQVADLSFTLGLGGTTETVVVTGSTPLLVTEKSGLEVTIESKTVEELPQGERSALAFVNLVPGTIDAGFALAQGENMNTNGNAQGPIGAAGNRNFFDSNFSVNGGRSSTNDVLLDGVSNTAGDFNGVAVSPPQDAIREMKVQSGSYSAEYGRSGGGIVNIVTKSGGQKYQGSAYLYEQDGEWNANGWQRNRLGLPRLDYERHQFGGSIGGPVIVPGLIDRQSKKLFFFFNYEGRRERNPFSRELTVPTDRMRRGDLSELLTGAERPGVANPDGSPALFGQIYDPFAPLVNGLRQPIPGNRLDLLPACAPGPRTRACLDPVAMKLLTYLPSPNRPGLANNFLVDETAKFQRNIHAGRVDANLSGRQNLFGRYSYERRYQAEPNFFNSPATNSRVVRDTFYNFTFNHTWVWSKSVVNNLRYGQTHLGARQIPNGEGFDPVTLGLPASLRENAAILKFPDFTFGSAGAAGLGLAGEITSGQIGGAGNNQPRNTYTIANAVTLTKRSHVITTGGEFRLYKFNAFQFFTPTGSFAFNRTWTRGPSPTAAPLNAAETGSSLASLFLGLPTSGDRQALTPLDLNHKYGAMFVQDDWRIHPNLTINLGLRWDIETGTEEADGLITNFDREARSHLTGVPTPTDPHVRQLNPAFGDLRGLLGFVEGPQTRASKTRFAPRAGFAFRINDRTTLRGGFGVFYVPLSLEPTTAQGNDFRTSLLQSPQTAQIVQPGGPSQETVFLGNPFPQGLPAIPGARAGANTLIGQSIFAVEPDRDKAYNQQWNLVIQRQLADALALDVAYVGSHGVNLPIQVANLNQLSAEMMDYARENFAAAGATSPTTFFTQQVPNPFFGIITNPNSALRLATVQRLFLLRAFPQYDAVQLFRPHWGKSDYHAFQVNLTRRYKNGFSGNANYTWSRLMDTGGVGNGAAFLDATSIEDIYHFDDEYSVSTLDVPHRFVGSWNYELPFGKGKRWGANWSGLLQHVLGGWQTSGIVTWQSGTPIQIIVPGFPVSIGNATRRPNRVPGEDAQLDAKTAHANVKAGGPWFNTAAFTPPGDFQFGNASRTYGDVRRDAYKNVNLSILKNLRWGRHRLQIRGEFINAFNLVVYGTPGRDVTQAATFGVIRTQGNTPRTIQLVARYTF